MLKRTLGFSGVFAGLLLAAVAMTGCGTRAGQVSTGEELAMAQEQIDKLEQEVDVQKRAAQEAARKAEEARQQAERAAAQARAAEAKATPASPIMVSGSGDAVPANAKPGECFARVLVPPVYEASTEEVLVREASSKLEIVPAKYEWVEEKILVKEASSTLAPVSAKYEWVEEKVLVTPARTYWKKGRGPVEKVDNSTGEIMCLIEEEAVYKTVRKKVQVAGPSTTSKEIPAEYKTVKVRKLVTPAREKRVEIPAEYNTVSKRTMITPSKVEWRAVLCETNMKKDVVMQIQRALETAGHNPGPIDGKIGPLTLSAVRSYQQEKSLPTGGLTMGTIRSLGVRL